MSVCDINVTVTGLIVGTWKGTWNFNKTPVQAFCYICR